MSGGKQGQVNDSELLRIYIHGATVFELLRTALEFDLFEHLESAAGMDLPQVAGALGVEQRPARMMLLGLASLGLIRNEGGRYVNSEIVRRKLLRGNPRFVGPLVDIQAKIINPGIADFAESMRRNTNVGLRTMSGPGTTLYERLTAHPDLQEIYYSNTDDASRKAFPQVLENFDFSGLKHVVDLAGGSGVNAIVLAQRYPHLEITLYDQDTVVQIASGNAEAAGVADRVHVAERDIFAGEYTGDVDGFLAMNIFGIWSLERNTELFRKCYRALPDGGPLLVFDFVCDDDNTGPLTAGMISPYFLALSSEEGMVYAPRDMEQALRDAGFGRIERYDGLGFNHALVIGYK
jgi:hypothetical protein